MASIACAALRSHPSEVPINESSLVATIATRFIDSNCLKSIATQGDRHLIAASALAVHLFKGKVCTLDSFPGDEKEYEKHVLLNIGVH